MARWKDQRGIRGQRTETDEIGQMARHGSFEDRAMACARDPVKDYADGRGGRLVAAKPAQQRRD